MNETRQHARAQLDTICRMVDALNVDYGRLEELQAWQEEWLINKSGLVKQVADCAAEIALLKHAANGCTSRDEAKTAIRLYAKQIAYRSGWAMHTLSFEPAEFRIVLSEIEAGAPDCRIVGEYVDYEINSARIEYLDNYVQASGNVDYWAAYCGGSDPAILKRDYDALIEFCRVVL